MKRTKFNYCDRRIQELEKDIQLLELLIKDSGVVEGDVAHKIVEQMRSELMELILLGDEDVSS